MRTFCKLKPSALLTSKVWPMTRVKMQHDHVRVLLWCVGVRGSHSTIAIWWLLGVSQLVAVWRLGPGHRSPDCIGMLCVPPPATIATIATLPHPRTGRCCAEWTLITHRGGTLGASHWLRGMCECCSSWTYISLSTQGVMPSDAGYKGRLCCWPQDAVSLTLAALICTTLLACAELSANTMLRWRKWASSPSILECQLSCLDPARILFDLRPVSSEQSTVLRELCILACAGAKMGSSTSTQTHKHLWYHVISK